MSVIIPEGFANAAWIINGNYGTGPFVFTMGVGVASAGPDLTAVANQLMVGFREYFRADLSNGLTFQKVQLTVSDGDVLGSVDSDEPPFAGTRNSGDDVIALSLLADKRTALLGRRGRGRLNIPGVLDDEDTGLGGEYTTSARESFQQKLDDFYTYCRGDQPGQTDPLALEGFVLHSDDTTPTPIQRLVLNRRVGVLRKRLR